MGLDLVTVEEKDLGGSVLFEDTAFSFAFLDYANPLVSPGGGTFLAADFNENGVVDGADLNAWKTGFGTGTQKAQGDADADGDVDGSDYLVWQRQFGTLPTAAAAAAAVPEPSAIALALTAGLAFIARRRK